MVARLQIDISKPGPDSTFVGRVKELTAFRHMFERMLDGQRQILTLAGEPGVGKTRLAEAFAEVAEEQGALVFWGRCYEEPGAPPYWPWVQILREFIDASSPGELQRMAGSGAGPIATLVPELGLALGGSETAAVAPLEPGGARFNTFDAIGGFLRRAAKQVPLVLIIDNAHCADKASLSLLEFLSQELVHVRLLIVCTYRDTEISRQKPLFETLGELSRGDGIERLKLGGLDRGAIEQLARVLLGQDLPTRVLDAIDQQTDGNPLFVIELVKVLIEESQQAGVEPIAVHIPDGVRETIGRRLSRLTDEVNELLRCASIIGRRFDATELVCVAEIDIESVLAGLQLAESAGFVDAIEESQHAYRFTHALIRETLYDEIPNLDRLKLHGLAGDTLAALDPRHESVRLSQIARHYFEAAALDNVAKAVDYAERAGLEAMRLDAYEEAVEQFGNVVSLLRQYGIDDAERLREAILIKSRALFGTGDVDGAAALLVESIGDGTNNDVEWLADVASHWVILRSSMTQDQQLPVLRRLLELLPDNDCAARAKVLAAHALAERTLGRRSGTVSQVEKAMAIARRVGDPNAICHCLRIAFLALHGDPATLEYRLQLGEEFLRVAPSGDHCERLAEASYQQALNLLEAGRIDDVERLLDNYETLKAGQKGLHAHRTRTCRIVVSLLRGEYDGLVERIEALQRIGMKTRKDDADGVYGAQMFALRRDLGTLGEVAPIVEQFAASPIRRAWAPGLMLVLIELGKLDLAREEFERLSADGYASIPNDDMRVTTLVYCVEACAALTDVERAPQLYELLLPYRQTFASHPTAVSFGSTELFLGMLASTMSKTDTANQHFEAALQANAAAGAWPWYARTCYRYALALNSMGAAADSAHAERLLREGEQTAGSLGMAALAADINRLLRGRDICEPYPDALTAREVDVLRLIAIGRSNKDIAKVLSISLNTVATHVRNILTKTDCANRTEAALYASRNKLVESR